ncbi:DUF4360 domain-containing protein [Spartinivicinus poritis]|uniref:DUF4360 domain-containing protein n=1 Tax=Spartinivicinus poritis TaxID=2994640 RepID=A0ABT5U512_9GAMM|nr:DUF4360 domain-containing protein [Spartinivicinus sp. A2-2]MDE1461435.1 DUF4360 domain-containing protein [Spartinivicinus sp. A2-2]
MKYVALISSLVISASSLAYGDGIGIDPEKVRFLGGCSGLVDTNPDKSFDIIFDEQLQAEAYDGRERKTCVVKFPIQMPAGYQLAISRVGFEGVAMIQYNGKGQIALRHRLAGTTGNAAIQEFFPSNFPQNITVNKNFAGYSFSPCGQTVTFKTSITVEAENGRVVIDEAAGRTVNYGYEMVQCGQF